MSIVCQDSYSYQIFVTARLEMANSTSFELNHEQQIPLFLQNIIYFPFNFLYFTLVTRKKIVKKIFNLYSIARYNVQSK